MIWYESLVRIVAGKGKKVTGNKSEHLGKRFVHTAVHKVASPYAQHCTALCTALHRPMHNTAPPHAQHCTALCTTLHQPMQNKMQQHSSLQKVRQKSTRYKKIYTPHVNFIFNLSGKRTKKGCVKNDTPSNSFIIKSRLILLRAPDVS